MTGVSCGGGRAVNMCVCVCVYVRHTCVTREHEPGSKEHMFRVLLRPVLGVDSVVWVWVGISKGCSG